MTTCATPIAGPALLDYWLEGADADRVEEHLVACGSCSAALRALAPITRALRELREGTPAPIATRAQLDARRAAGVRVTEVRAVLGGEVTVAIDDADLYVVAVPVELAGVERIDLEYCRPDGELVTLLPDAPVEPGAHEILIACERHIAVAHDAIRFRVRARGAAGDHLLADFQLRAVRT